MAKQQTDVAADFEGPKSVLGLQTDLYEDSFIDIKVDHVLLVEGDFLEDFLGAFDVAGNLILVGNI